MLALVKERWKHLPMAHGSLVAVVEGLVYEQYRGNLAGQRPAVEVQGAEVHREAIQILYRLLYLSNDLLILLYQEGNTTLI